MIINKVINNNVLSTHDENNREIVLMGKGIGFQKKVGDEVAEDKIEKKFVLDSEDEVGKFSGKNNVQVIIGTKVQFVADEFKKLCK